MQENTEKAGTGSVAQRSEQGTHNPVERNDNSGIPENSHKSAFAKTAQVPNSRQNGSQLKTGNCRFGKCNLSPILLNDPVAFARIKQRILASHKVIDSCWVWQRDCHYITKRASINVKKHYYSAARASWIVFRGPIPFGQCVLHKCDDPRCVNPDHLFLGTQADNMRDKVSKGRQVSPPQKLTVEKVLELRRLRQAGASRKSLATQFGINERTAQAIYRGQLWKNVPMPQRIEVAS